MSDTPITRAWPAAVALAAALGGCAVAPTAPTVLVLPGAQKSAAQFQTDSAVCQQQAHAQAAAAAQDVNNQAAGTAVVSAALGAAIGALLGQPYYTNSSAAWGAGSGLLVGSTMGSSASMAANVGLQQRYDTAYAQCMVLQGNQLPSMAAGYRRMVPAFPPPPPPPAQRPPMVPPPNTPPPV